MILPKQNRFDPNYDGIFLSIDKEIDKKSSFMIEVYSHNDWRIIMAKLEALGILWLSGDKPTSLDFPDFDKGDRYYIFVEEDNGSSCRISTISVDSISHYEYKIYGVPINSNEYWKNLV